MQLYLTEEDVAFKVENLTNIYDQDFWQKCIAFQGSPSCLSIWPTNRGPQAA